MAAQFLGFQQLQTGFQRSVEDALAIAGCLPSMEQETAELRGLLDASRTELEATKTRLQESEARGAELAQKLADQAEQLAQERGAASASAAAARQALADLEAEVALFREGAVLADPVRAEIERLREDLAGAGQRLAQDAQDAARMQSEIMQMRHTVGRAMQIAQDGAARAEVLEAEIASLQDALATARQVGRAALDALAIAQPRAEPGEPLGRWRRPLRRLLRLQARRQIPT
jgi:chromosome segregation ATPase